jgi:hypothetical protein
MKSGQPWGGLTWTSRQPVKDLPWPTWPYQMVAWNGGYIGIGSSTGSPGGPIVVGSSADLVTWRVLAKGTSAPEGSSPDLLVVPAGLVVITENPINVCGAGNSSAEQVWTSKDGVSWKRSAGVRFQGCGVDAVAGPRGVLTHETNYLDGSDILRYSETGDSWKTANLSGPEFRDGGIASIAATPGGFVAVGCVSVDNCDNGGKAAAWWSVDGLTWTQAQVDTAGHAGDFQFIYRLSYGLVTEGDAGQLWFSTDGHAWKLLPKTNALYQAFISNVPGFWSDSSRTVFESAENYGVFWETTDGKAWKVMHMNGEGPRETIDGAPTYFLASDGLVGIFEGGPAFGPIPDLEVVRAVAIP